MREVRGRTGPRPGGTAGIGERGEAGELEEDEMVESEGLLQEIMVVMMTVEPEDLQDALLLTVTYGGVVVEEEDKTDPLSEVVVTLVPALIIPGLEMTDPVTGAKARLAVESVEPSLEMRDQESGQLVNKTTAGPRSSVDPASTIKFWGRICESFSESFTKS